jgi:FRG domain
MNNPFKLYWVEAPSPDENCFVAARSKRAAAKHEEDETGFDPGHCEATAIRALDNDWVAEYRGLETSENLATPFYVQPEDVHQLGIKWRVVEGDDIFEYGDHQYLKQGGLNYIASLGKNPQAFVIRSVADLLGMIKRDDQGDDWIFRGHSSSFWRLEAGVHRFINNAKADLESIINKERSLLSEFKRRARIYLQIPPSSNWEWMVVAQHFGLPTRMLDWTEALYFSVRDRQEISNDGMLYAYQHGVQEIDIESTSDPFAIEQIELVRPPHLDQRVIVQRSIFTAEPPRYEKGAGKASNLRYWYVSAKYKAEIRRELATLGISENSLFPGLASLAAEIKEELTHPNLVKRISLE